MKISIFICCALMFACLPDFAKQQEIEEKIIPRNVDALMTDDLTKMKRPFCNAFTGCGKKRSFSGKLPGPQYYENKEDLRPLYKALVKAANQNAAINENTDGYRILLNAQDYDSYFDEKPAFRGRLQS